jgi:outer membrane lipoprotein carrier protein
MKRIILIFLFLIINIAAQDSDQRLKTLQDTFEKVNDLSVDVIQKSGGEEVLSGKLFYKKQNRFYLDLKNNLIVSDGSSIWNYNKKQNKVIINTVDESDPSFFSFNSFVYDYPSKCNITSGQNGNVLVLIPKTGSDLNFNSAKLRINNENLPDKIILEGSAAGEVEIIFSNYNINRKLSDSKFQFTPPEGSSVIDLR